MISVIASIKVKSGHVPEFIAIFKANVEEVRREKGCIEYMPAIDIDSGIPVQSKDSSIVTIIEKWESLDALKAHLKAPHMGAYREKVKDMVESVSLKVLQEA
ncbi:MAG: antibiotic biosynthesis monooxygenase [Lentisphaerae bacterium GWF2_49_21]|nr:MAG: antibiotic biosynthesis monooxygenase [Lentisphaerae bacterium GWF2_49_21]